MPFLALAFLTGIAFVMRGATLPSVLTLSGLALAAAAAWGWRARWLATLLAGIVAAALQGQVALEQDWPCDRDRERVGFIGTVIAPAEPGAGRVDFDVAPDAAARRYGLPQRVRLSWYEPTATPRPGDAWRLEVILRCRGSFQNPGGYDRELDLLRRGVGATGYVAGKADPELLARAAWQAPVQVARDWVATRIATATGGSRSTGVLQGLTVGLRGSIDPAIREAIVNTGTAHLIAISGMHVTAFALVALLVSRRVYAMAASPRMSAHWPWLQAVGVGAVTLGYGLLAGASLPTVRTVAMVAVAAVLRVARRPAGAAEVLGFSALLLAAVDPLGTTSAGFWLSFAAVAALLALLDPGAGPGRVLRTFARAQAAVTVVLAPVLVAAFGGVPWTAPLVNALAIPLFSLLVLPGTLLGMALLPAAPGPAERFWALFATALDRSWPALEWLAGLPGAVFRPPTAPAWLVVLATGCCLAAVMIPGRSARILAAITLAALALRPAPAPPYGGFELVVLDVGQGLAAVVHTAHRTLLFDTGPRWRSGSTAAAVTVTPYLHGRGIDHLDMLVVSHADADHAGGLEEVVSRFSPRWVLGSGLDRALGDEACRAGRRWEWDGVTFEVLHPADPRRATGNDGSCALRVSVPGAAALLLADPEAAAERDLLARNVAADVVIVPHHGSASSSSPAFVEAVGPRWALVSAGFGNRWGLPRPEVVARWRDAGAEVVTTAGGGALSLRLGPGGESGPLRRWRVEDARWWRRE